MYTVNNTTKNVNGFEYFWLNQPVYKLINKIEQEIGVKKQAQFLHYSGWWINAISFLSSPEG